MSKTFLAVVVIAAAIAGALSLSARLPQGAAPVGPPLVQGADDGVNAAHASAASNPISPTREASADSFRVGTADGDTGVPSDEARIEELERRIRQYIGQVPGLRMTSLNSVQCDDIKCEIVFTGTDANPQYVDQYSEFSDKLWRQVSDDGFVEFLTGGLGTREVAAGAKEYVMGFTYVPIDAPSRDPQETARQHAACAGAWLARADEAQSKNFEETAGQAREMAEREFAIAAPVLGREEAERIAASRARGPLLAECVPARMYVSG